jgi:hypothetical protein
MPNIDLQKDTVEIKSLIFYHYFFFLLNNCHFFYILNTSFLNFHIHRKIEPSFLFNKKDL